MSDKISFTKMSTVQDCPAKFNCRYVQRYKPQFQAFALVQGSFIHEIVQANFRAYLPADFAAVMDGMKSKGMNMLNSVDPAEVQEKAPDPVKWTDRCFQAAAALTTAINDAKTEHGFPAKCNVTIEEKFSMEVLKYNGQIAGTLDAYVDLHFFDPDAKRHMIIELKTTGRTPANGEASMSHVKQAIIYKRAIDNAYALFTGGPIVYMIVYAVMTKEIKTIPVLVEFEKYQGFASDVIGNLWDAMREIKRMESDGVYPRNLGMGCGWCDYRAACIEGDFDGLKKDEY